ncbi:hypothetical protein [Rufibacter aurantiacus]|uniref:hypothetical protein n=1 Tax=Rufibacter aurantiacus TaxID=2817374 RepID=UPI001B3040CB|nr:hypothetical protein [Rufibacter aurantiacus]
MVDLHFQADENPITSFVTVRGAREQNLKNMDFTIPRRAGGVHGRVRKVVPGVRVARQIPFSAVKQKSRFETVFI